MICIMIVRSSDKNVFLLYSDNNYALLVVIMITSTALFIITEGSFIYNNIFTLTKFQK